MQHRYTVGLDIGGTRCKMGVVDLAEGRVLSTEVFPTANASANAFFASLAEAYRAQAAFAAENGLALHGLGVGIGCYVFEGGVLDSAWSHMRFLDDMPLAQRLSEMLGQPCHVGNDTEVNAIAEAVYGAGKGHARALTLTLGTGVGVGFTVDGAPQNREPAIHLAGHIRVRAGDGSEFGGCLDEPPCYCSVKGCLESTCSGTALEQLAKHELCPETDNPALFRLAGTGDAKARAVVDWYLDMLSCGLNQYAFIFCPDVILLGGGVANALEPWLPRLNDEMKAEVHTRHAPRVVRTQLMEGGGILGAAVALAQSENRV